MEDASLKKNKGEDDIEDPVYKDLNADGDIQDDDECDEPACYVMSTRPTVTVKFKIDPPLEEATDVWIKGEGMGQEDQGQGSRVHFHQDEVSMNGGWGTVSSLHADEGDAVAEQVKIHDLKIAWS